MPKLARDKNTTTLHPRENLVAAGNLAALNAEIVIETDGSSSIALDLRGPFSGSVVLEGTIDGSNYTSIPVRPLNVASVSYLATITGTVAGIWVGKCTGFMRVRARVSAYTSGTFIATLVAGTGILDDSLQGLVTPVVATAVGAAGAAVTLTLASPGAGLRHYLTYLSINRFAAAALTAAATPVTVTTSNIPGALALSFAADAAAQGTIDRWREDFAYPVATSAQATATTIVCPVTTGVLWRVTAGYYVAP